jgi:hypothetical protein
MCEHGGFAFSSAINALMKVRFCAVIYRKLISLQKSCSIRISGITNQKQTIDSLTDIVSTVSSSLPVRMD